MATVLRGRPVEKGVIFWPRAMELMGPGLRPCLFLEVTLGLSRPTHGSEYIGALRRAPQGSSSGSRTLANARNIASNADPAGSVRQPRRDKTSKRTNEREEPKAFLCGETHLHLRSGVKAQSPTPQTINKARGNRHTVCW